MQYCVNGGKATYICNPCTLADTTRKVALAMPKAQMCRWRSPPHTQADSHPSGALEE